MTTLHNLAQPLPINISVSSQFNEESTLPCLLHKGITCALSQAFSKLDFALSLQNKKGQGFTLFFDDPMINPEQDRIWFATASAGMAARGPVLELPFCNMTGRPHHALKQLAQFLSPDQRSPATVIVGAGDLVLQISKDGAALQIEDQHGNVALWPCERFNEDPKSTLFEILERLLAG